MFEVSSAPADPAALVAGMVEAEREAARAMARQAEAIAALHEHAVMLPDEVVPETYLDRLMMVEAEVATALRVSSRTASVRVAVALALTGRLPGTMAALRAGDLDWFRARIVAEETSEPASNAAHAVIEAGGSPAAARRAAREISRRIEERILDRAVRQTPALLRRSLARAVIAVDPGAAERRRRDAVKERRATFRALPDAMAELCFLMPAAEAVGVWNRLDHEARTAHAAGDSRTLDQLRVDALAGLVGDSGEPADCARDGSGEGTDVGDGATNDDGDGANGDGANDVGDGANDVGDGANDVGDGANDDGDGANDDGDGANDGDGRNAGWSFKRGATRRAKAHVVVHVSADTLLGLDDEPGALDGYGPIPAALARAIAARHDSTWRRILTEPATGALLEYGRTTYRPPAALADQVIARDRSCTFPSCNASAARCDLDHVVPYPAGETGPGNLHALCRRHHLLKHRGRWNVEAGEGGLEWTSPTGRRHRRQHAPPLVA